MYDADVCVILCVRTCVCLRAPSTLTCRTLCGVSLIAGAVKPGLLAADRGSLYSTTLFIHCLLAAVPHHSGRRALKDRLADKEF